MANGFDEKGFQDWYSVVSTKNGLNPNPDDPLHFYDYRAAYKSGVRGPDDTGHWPSDYKLEGHPNLIVDGVDTRSLELPQKKHGETDIDYQERLINEGFNPMPDSIPEGAGQEIDEYDRAVEDNFSNAYLKRREAFGVINSPAFRALETLHIEPQEGPDSTTEPKEGQEAVSHEPVIHPADAYLMEKFPEPISTITTQPKPTMQDEMEGRKGLWENVGKPVLKAIGINLDSDQDAFDKWVGDFEQEFGRPPEFSEVPQEIWDKIEWDNAEIPLDAPKKLIKGAAKQALKAAGKQADDVLGFSKKPILEIMEGGADDAGDEWLRHYHQTHIKNKESILNDGFDFNRVGASGNDPEMPNGVYFKNNADDIGVGGYGKDAAQIEADVKLKSPLLVNDREEFVKILREDERYLKAHMEYGRYDNAMKRKSDEMFDKLVNLGSRRSEKGKEYSEKTLKPFLDEWQSGLKERAAVARGLINDILGKKGYDGVVMFRDSNGSGKIVRTTVALSPGQVRVVKKGNFAGNINFTHIQTTDDAKALIDDVAKRFEGQIDEARRGVVSHEETMELANLTGMTPERLLARRKGQAFNAHEALAARQILVSSAENLTELAQKVTLGTASDMEKFAFRKQLSTHYALQAQVSGMTAEAGRALNAFRITAESQQGKQLAIKEMLASMDGKSTDQIAQMLSTMDTPEQIGKFVQDAQKANSFDMLLEAWINGLLSGPQTHMVNTTSNALVSLWMVPERLIASAFSKVPKLGSGEIQAKEALYQAYGLVEGFKDGLRAMGHTLKTGEAPDVIGKLEQGYRGAIRAENVKKTFIGSKFGRHLDEGTRLARAVDLIGEGWRMPGRFLEAEDALFKSVGYRMELRARAFRQASLEGLEGDAAATRIHQILSDPETFAPDVHLAAIDAARYQTFTQPLGEGGKSIQGLTKAFPALKFVIPFVRTPTNILKFAFERTPLAAMAGQFRSEIFATGANATARSDLAKARLAMGSMIMLVAGSLAASGKITGGGPSNSGMRALKRNEGWQEYSIDLGGHYASYGRMEPIGMVFGLAADVAEIMGQTDDLEAQELAAAATMAISKNMTSKTWLRGFSEALNAMDDPDRYGERYWENFGASFVPNIITQTERSLSPEISAVYGLLDRYKAKIPGYSDDLPPSRNVWGEVESSGMGGYTTFLPTYISKKKDSPISAEMFRLGMPAGMPGQNTKESGFAKEMNFNGVDLRLTPHEYDRFIVLMNETPLDSTGITLKKSMNRLIKTKDYKDLDEDDKKTAIRRVFTEAKRRAKEMLLEENPELQSIINAELAKQGN